MTVMNDVWIRKMVAKFKMIQPFERTLVSEIDGHRVISFGTSSYGYDTRLDNTFKIFTNVWGHVVDPKNFNRDSFVEYTGGHCIIPPNSFCLSQTYEYFKIPKDVLVLCVGKSTYARCGIIVNVTPLEPEWEGHITLEISNTSPLPAKVYADEGICQLVFLRGNEPPSRTYADRKGKYQGQREITLPKV